MFGIPCVGFGPAAEEVAHTVNDSVPIEHLVKCAAMYAAFPSVYCAGSTPAKSNGKAIKNAKRRL
jgi:acetylornithine deacetylase/succinyl-diaminopimelate desuccinylase-like protein